jgi:hypothetical protein
MRKSILILIALISFTGCVIAQDSENLYHKWTVTVKPIGFFDPFMSNFTGTVMYRFGDQWVGEAQLGLIYSWYPTYFQNEEQISKTGFRAGGEVKYLFTKRLYVAGQVFHNNYTKTSEEEYWRFGRSYVEELEIERHFHTTGGHIKFGMLIWGSQQRLMLDFYTGLGFRNRLVTIQNLPADAEPLENRDFSGPFFTSNNEMNKSKTLPSVTLGISVGFAPGKMDR